MKSVIATAFAFALFVIASIIPATAQYGYGSGVGTGGTMALRQGVPHAQTVYEDQCRRIGAHNHPMCMTGRGHHQMRRPAVYGHQRVYYGPAPMVRRGPPIIVGGYGAVREPIYQGVPRAAIAAPPPPPPSPAQVNRMTNHKKERVSVDCDTADGFARVQGSNRCAKTTWVPGED